MSISRIKPNAASRFIDDEAEEQDNSSSQAETDSSDEEKSQLGNASDESDPFMDGPKSRHAILLFVSVNTIKSAPVLVLIRERW